MSANIRKNILCSLILLLSLGCSSTENRGDGDADAENNSTQDIEEEDAEETPEDIGEGEDILEEEDIRDGNGEDEDIREDEPEPGVHDVESTPLEGMIELAWELPEDNTLTEIRITGSPAELMWGEAERVVEPTATDYLFDKLVNDIQYSFKIQAFSGDEEVGEPLLVEAAPYSRLLLAVKGRSPAPMIDSVTKQPARGWEALTDNNAYPTLWSPDGTKFLTWTYDNGFRCAFFDRATRKEIRLTESDEFYTFCLPRGSWSPDNRRFVYIRHLEEDGMPAQQHMSYAVLDLETGEIETGWPDPSAEAIPPLALFGLDWSPDGSRLAIAPTYSTQSARLMVINAHTKQIEPGWPAYPDLDIGNHDPYMQWSPDSQRLAIAYSGNTYTGQPSGYLVLNAQTKEVETEWPDNVTPSPKNPAWSPDGELLFLTFGYSPGDSIQVINTTTRENEAGWPTDWPLMSGVAWSYDSRFLAMSSTTSPYLIILDRYAKEEDEGWAPRTEPADGVAWSPQHDPPGAPTDVELIRTEQGAALSWSPPDEPNILDYRVTIEPADQVDGPADYLLRAPQASEYQVEGLDPGVDYTLSISAISVFGVGEAAAVSF